MHIRIRLDTKFQLKLTTLIFWTKFASKKVFSVENAKSKHHYWILHIQISTGTKFKLRLTILIFLTNITQKGYFWSKTEKVNITIESCIYELVWVPNFSLTTILILWTKFAQKVCLKLKIRIFACAHCRFLQILNFFARGPTDTTVFVKRQDKGA